MSTYVPVRELIENAWYRALRGRGVAIGTGKLRWGSVWLAATDGFEGQTDARGRRLSTCAIFVNRLLRDCGCLEPWVHRPKWGHGLRAVRRWPSEVEISNPRIEDISWGDLLVWRMFSSSAHTGIVLYTDPERGAIWTAEGGQFNGGAVKERLMWDRQLPDCVVKIDRLQWSGTAPTVGQWLEQEGLPPGQCRCEDFIPEGLLPP